MVLTELNAYYPFLSLLCVAEHTKLHEALDQSRHVIVLDGSTDTKLPMSSIAESIEVTRFSQDH